ncbi:MAG: autotransporter domain-containing protein [Terricaulis sp.]
MRIKAVHVAGLAVALMGGAAKDALADTTVSTSTTTPLQTSTAGNVTVATGGAINVNANQTAITVNSNNSVTNGGTLGSKDADNSVGILLGNGFGGTINNTGAITLSETYVITDTDSDGDLDGAWAQGSNRFGILLNAGSAFTGNITSSGSITVSGNNSAGISLNAPVTGNIDLSGSITVNGDNSSAVHIGGAGGGITGDVFIRTSNSVRGVNSTGIDIDAPISGQLRINGTSIVSGFHSLTRPTDTSHLDADDTLIGGAAIAIHSSVAGGVTLEGIGVEDDVDDDGDGVTEAAGDTNDDVTINVTSVGSAPAILVQADPSANLVLGVNANNLGLQIKGTVTGAGVYDGIIAHAITVLGNGASTTTINGGIALDFNVTASSTEADAFGLLIGAGASTPQVLQRKSLTVTSLSETAHNAYGIYLDTGANVPSISNTGTFVTQVFGEVGNAVAITDRSNTLTTITNTGTLQARVVATDSDPTDNVPPPPVTGTSTAIDVSTSTVGVTFNQTPDVPFTDDDTVDDDSASRPTIQTIGDIKFGSGADTVNLQTGTITGNISFGAGADSMVVANGSTFTGRITDSDGALTMNVNGTVSLKGGQTDITSATFGATSQLGVLLSATPSENTHIVSSGTVTFAAGARVLPAVPTGLPTSGTFTFLTANGGLIGGSNVTGNVTGTGVPFVYNLNIAQTGNSLDASFILKTPTQLGLNSNQAIAFTPIINALRQDTTIADAFAGLTTQGQFDSAFGQLMPSYSSASAELATTAISQQQSATTNRLSATRLHDLNEVSVWAQEIGYVITRDPPSGSAGDRFRGSGFGLAAGIDGPLNNGALFGLSASFTTSDAEEPIRPDGQISSTFGQGNAYLGSAVGPIDLDVVVGAGVGRMQERRVVEFGSVSELATAQWWAYEGHAMLRASAPMRTSNWLVLTPQASLTYVGLQEQGYTEEGGGAAIDLKAKDAFSQRLWADAGLEFSARFHLGGDSIFAPRVYLGYRANAIDETTDRQFQFVSTGESFTLTDDKLGSGGPVVGFGIDATNGYSSVSLSYEGEFTDQIDRHSLNVAIRYRF